MTVRAGAGRQTICSSDTWASAPYSRSVYAYAAENESRRRVSLVVDRVTPRLPGRITVGPPRVSLSSQTRCAYESCTLERQKLRNCTLAAVCQPSPWLSLP